MSVGPLLQGFFETAYVVRDMDAALEALHRRDGVGQFLVFAPPPSRGPVSHMKRVAKAFVGVRMIELIEPNLSIVSMFHEFVPEQQDGMRLHHLGYLIKGDAEWDAMRAAALENRLTIAYEGFVAGMVRSTFLDTRSQLGHYSEYLQNYKGGSDLMDSIPQNAIG